VVKISNPQKLKLGLRIFALAGFIGLIIYLSIRFTPELVALFQRRQELKEHMESWGIVGILVFILFQIFQVVVAAVPGEVVQLAGGFFFGTFWGAVYLVIGVVIGSIIDFYLARLLGYDLVKTFVPEKRLHKMYSLLSGSKSDLVMFLLFLVPGLPKDILTYIAGLTPVRPGRFILIAVTARLPALVASSYLGSSLQQENLQGTMIIAVVVTVLFVMGLLFKDRLIALARKP